MRRGAYLGIAVGLVAALVAGCQDGSIGDEPSGGCVGCSSGSGPGNQTEPLTDSLRFPRLSHPQWENTVQDLFHLAKPTGLSDSFTPDTLAGSFDDNEQVLEVTPNLWADYQNAAEEVALTVTHDPATLTGILPPDTGDDMARAKAFVESFGKRAFRRPLTPDEIASYTMIYVQGTMIGDGDTPFLKGIDLLLQAFLQSPYFLYKAQLGTTVQGDGIPLDSWEIASKLSYMLWNSMPDDELFAAAEGGKLDTPDAIEAQAKRMLDAPRGHATIGAFHKQLFQYQGYHDLYKDPMLFPGFDPALGDSMEQEASLFVDDIVYQGGGIAELLTEPHTFVDSGLAKIYGLQGNFTSQFQRVELDPKQRAGFLTHIGFLASKATKREQDSIHRGVFVIRRIVCLPLGNPQPNVPPVPPDSYPTNRERVDHHTGKGTCGESCHGTMINPAGFAFEHYDAIGQYQTIENGEQINSADTLNLTDGPISYADGVEFSQKIAQSNDVASCYSRYWLEYAFGRPTTDKDAVLLKTLAGASKKGTRELLLAIVRSRAFGMRAVEVSQ